MDFLQGLSRLQSCCLFASIVIQCQPDRVSQSFCELCITYAPLACSGFTGEAGLSTTCAPLPEVNCAQKKGTRTSLVNLCFSRAPCSLPPPAYLAAPRTGLILAAYRRLARGYFDMWVVDFYIRCGHHGPLHIGFSSFCRTVDRFGKYCRWRWMGRNSCL